MSHAKHNFDETTAHNHTHENGRKPRRRLEDMPPAEQAGILCNDPRFQKFAAIRCGLPDQQFNNTAAKAYLYEVCHIESRRELTIASEPNNRFQELRTEFDAWSGKIAAQR